jgi:transcriptional regulator with XRE-family HTH domain
MVAVGRTVKTRHAAPLRWLIGSELASYREQAGMTLSQVSAITGISTGKLHHLENGRQQQDPEDIAALLEAYGRPARDVDRLTALSGRADEATWWAPWAAVVPDWFRTFVTLEGLATEEVVFEPLVIPGLLQTQEYAAAITADAKNIRPDHGERTVSFRMARAARLTDPDRPLRLHAVIPEWALRLAVGSQEVRNEQLRHLVEMTHLPTVTIQVLRPEDGPHSAMNGGFVALDFGSAARPVVYLEQKDGAMYLQDDLQVEAYRFVASDLAQVAMGPEQSRELITSLCK